MGAAGIGRYEILDRIGVGGMAEVFRARAHGPGGYVRELILKRILPHLAEDPVFVRALVDEAKILGWLDHPNVVGIYDFGEDQGRHYLALEYLDGPSVGTLVGQCRKAERNIPWPLVAFVAREVCLGLAAVHALRDPAGAPLGVVHRDVTPSNILTTRAGAVKLLDFGIARTAVSERLTRHGQIKGKAGYFAPEQIKGEPFDGRVDLFAVGVVMHEMLCLEHLFWGEGGDLGAIYRTLEMPAPRPSSLRADVPAGLDDVILKALAKDPGQRYQDASAMAADLTRFTDAAAPQAMAAFVAALL